MPESPAAVVDPTHVSDTPRIKSTTLLLYALLAALSLASPWLTRVSLFTLVLAFIAFVALPKPPPRVLTWLALGAGAASLVGFVRFLIHEAVPGIVQGGTSATEAAAVSKLREILFAEDSMRKLAAIDPDGDGVGSAGFIDELTGRAGLRGKARLSTPVLERYPAAVETALGPAVEVAGFYFAVCLPKAGGGFTAKPGEAVDDETAERRFVAYAWPVAADRGLSAAYFLDEHERILFAPNGAPAASRPRVGTERPPACDDALSPATREQWQVWRGKRPRDRLPGDH
jgi:hypothetical protein